MNAVVTFTLIPVHVIHKLNKQPNNFIKTTAVKWILIEYVSEKSCGEFSSNISSLTSNVIRQQKPGSKLYLRILVHFVTTSVRKYLRYFAVSTTFIS